MTVWSTPAPRISSAIRSPDSAATRYRLPSIRAAAFAAGDVYRIDVRVQFAPAVDYTLSGYRTRL
jgi:hypothetical protein